MFLLVFNLTQKTVEIQRSHQFSPYTANIPHVTLQNVITVQADSCTSQPTNPLSYIYAKNDLYTNSNAFRVLLLLLLLLVQFIACMLGPFHTFVLCARCRLGRPPRDFIPYFLYGALLQIMGSCFVLPPPPPKTISHLKCHGKKKNRRQYVIWCA